MEKQNKEGKQSKIVNRLAGAAIGLVGLVSVGAGVLESFAMNDVERPAIVRAYNEVSNKNLREARSSTGDYSLIDIEKVSGDVSRYNQLVSDANSIEELKAYRENHGNNGLQMAGLLFGGLAAGAYGAFTYASNKD